MYVVITPYAKGGSNMEMTEILNKANPDVTLEVDMRSWNINPDKTMHFLKGMSYGLGLENTHKALNLAQTLHKDQRRKSGAEYLVHPLRVCNELVALGFRNDDILLAAALLHDVIEDNEHVRNDPDILIKEYELSPEVVNLVKLLTKYKSISTEDYYARIGKDWRAILIKLSDRCNNVSTMDCFSYERMRKYIKETREFVLPLCHYGKVHHPRYGDAITVMKYHITAVCSVAEGMLNDFQTGNTATEGTT